MGRRALFDIPPGYISSSAAARIVGIPLPRLARWARTGLVRPLCYTGTPKDRSAAYAWRVPDVLAARAIVQLREQGLPLQRVRRVAGAIKKAGGDLSSVVLWSDGKDAFRVLRGDQLVSMVSTPGQHMVFPLSDWAADVEREHAAEVERIAEKKAG